MNLPDREDDQLEAWLREAAPDLPDNGFTNRVLTALPTLPAKPRRAKVRRGWLIAVGAIAGLAIAVLRWGGGENTQATIVELEQTYAQLVNAFAPMHDSTSGIAVGLAILCTAFALWHLPQSAE